MRIDDMDDYSVNLADAYARDAYQKGYEQGGKDAVKHGHWIFEDELVSGIKCSICKSSVFWTNAKRPKYCPNCGAKMDEK